jgi:hypothetical protein
MAACAVYVLGMVFSVQQGEHGPLVVYKLQVPPAEAPAPPATTYVIPSRAPAVLGTVVLPAERTPRAEETFDDAPLRLPERGLGFRVIEGGVIGEAMVNEKSGDVLTLQQINDDIAWRRDTVEKLRQVPIAPRF